MYTQISIAKPSEHYPNEDACIATSSCIAVSDGAGEWATYLLTHLPKETSIDTFEALDSWIDKIWEEFYTDHESKAKKGDSMLLNKFYNEGSFATLSAAWRKSPSSWHWMTYGDSVAFHYNRETDKLEHSFSTLMDFSKPPHLISCKDSFDKVGFRSGTFEITSASYVFVASDALSHYILMMYYLCNPEQYSTEIRAVKQSNRLSSQLLSNAEQQKQVRFYDDVLQPLFKASMNRAHFEQYMCKLLRLHVIDLDDYSLAFATDDI